MRCYQNVTIKGKSIEEGEIARTVDSFIDAEQKLGGTNTNLDENQKPDLGRLDQDEVLTTTTEELDSTYERKMCQQEADAALLCLQDIAKQASESYPTQKIPKASLDKTNHASSSNLKKSNSCFVVNTAQDKASELSMTLTRSHSVTE